VYRLPAAGPIACHAPQSGFGAARSGKLSGMERICSQCHAVLEEANPADWCPACGGALLERESQPAFNQKGAPSPEVDHRGIVLPRRHALGGIITPQ